MVCVCVCVCVWKKTLVLVHNPGSVNGKQSLWLGPSRKQFQPINTLHQKAHNGRCNLDY